LPETEEEWLQKAAEFKEKWQYPLSVGAIDGKHIHVQAFAKTGSEFFSYKGIIWQYNYQGDQIGQIFAQWAIVCFEQFLKNDRCTRQIWDVFPKV
jgi:hypothetical protein